MRRSNTAIAFSKEIHNYFWQSYDEDDGDDDACDAATAPIVAPPKPAPAAALPPPETPSGSSIAEMSAPRSNRRSNHSQVVLPSSIPGVVPAARGAEKIRKIDNPTPHPARQPSVVDRPLDSTDRPSPAAARPPVDSATTRHRSDPYHMVRANERVAPDQSTLDSIADYTEDWRPYRVNLLKNQRWWEWGHGIIDLRALYRTKSNAIAGTQLNVAFDACRSVLRRHACEFKVGMARTLGGRWELYQSSSDTWTPTHLHIVMHVRGRDAVGFAEAGLIGMLYECGDFDDHLNVNHRNHDRGGSGPRHEHELDDWFYVYLATMSVS